MLSLSPVWSRIIIIVMLHPLKRSLYKYKPGWDPKGQSGGSAAQPALSLRGTLATA